MENESGRVAMASGFCWIQYWITIFLISLSPSLLYAENIINTEFSSQ